MIKLIILLFLTVLGNIAQGKEVLAKLDGWKLIKVESSCFIFGTPLYSQGFTGFREKPHLLMKGYNKSLNSLTVFGGFPLQTSLPVQLIADEHSFLLEPYRTSFAIDDRNFNYSNFIKSLIQDGHLLHIRLVGQDGAVAHDYYDVRSLPRILNLFTSLC
jgi:hypothetical protein